MFKPRKNYYRRPPQPRGPRRNGQIRAPQVRLIDETGKNVGIVDIEKALAAAREKELDLIEISSKASPPVARIMEYGKYMYDQEKRGREAQKKQKVSTVTKGVRISMRTSEHDLAIKAQNVDKFLKKGYKVRVELFMRGREKALKEQADKKIEEFLGVIGEAYTLEQEPTRHPRGLYFSLKKK